MVALPVHMYVVNTMICAWVERERERSVDSTNSTGFGADCYSEPVRQLELAELFKQLLVSTRRPYILPQFVSSAAGEPKLSGS